ncbi:phosphoglycerate dehydrogenase [Bacillus shivajii]|uniref:phosphoglycerate dehydrogenase n=1 Tax=Bacillus shivajii TaxID=1983719 RepID=UPI001CFADC93|nr:phosphoglycerate dehydrogenase [Bacillus shivajii]UCZ52469.1 phosphoglycerate dehydrogenase [Bacillus shivajii]
MTLYILISDPISDDGINTLLETEDVIVDKKIDLSKKELLNCIGKYDALLVRSQTEVDRELIAAGKNLKAIGRAGVGVDNVDLNAATEHGVVVVNAPMGNTISTAEHTMAMLMAASRKIPQSYESLTKNEWNRKAYVGVELYQKTLGIIGFGRIGNEVSKRAKGFQMNVIAYDPFLTEEKAEKLGITCGSIDDVLKQADFITIHTPLLKETKHLINQTAFEKMKKGVYILNCARGGLVDEEALYHAITTGKVAGAALDVFENEPVINHELLNLPEVIATPHLGASTFEAQENVAVDVSFDVLEMLRGKPAKNPVNMPSVSYEVIQKLEPYYTLAEKIGSFLSQIAKGAIREIAIEYSGELKEINTDLLNRITVKGMLKKHLGHQINDVNAFHLAEQKEIVINEKKTTLNKGFTNLMTITVKTNEEMRSISGTRIEGLGIEFVNVDDYRVDVVPTSHMIFIRHYDKPGMIGKVGSFLGECDINIATMQVGRKEPGGEAIMLLSVDKHLKHDFIDDLKHVANIIDVTPIEL